ncbi:MAG: MFS transporter [Deltaproteobacteria bacterium]|nr:MAG: MFS transporter [Deltaproteobacteria bacterium]
MSETSVDQPKATGFAAIRQYFRDFKILKDNPREYWGMQLINIVDSTGYFAMLTVVTLFLSGDVGLSDTDAATVVSFFTAGITIMLLFTGPITDWLGIRWSLNTALFVRAGTTVGIGVLALGPDFEGRGWFVGGLFLLMAPTLAMVQTVFQVTNKRFTSKRSRSSGFNLWYMFMNLGAFLGGAMVALLRVERPGAEAAADPDAAFTYTWVILLGVVTSLVSLALTWVMVRREVQVHGPDESPEELASTDEEPVRKNPLANLSELLHQPQFYRFLVLIAATLGVRAVFVHMYMLMPKYWTRVIGPDAPIGEFNMINPILIVFGVIAIIPIAHRFNLFKMLVFGSMISALSLFALIMPWDWFGSDMATGYTWLTIFCMVLVTIGEVLWSPKLYEYTAAIAPEGQEGTYLGLSMMPWFAAKFAVSALSGIMLVRWVPEDIGPRIMSGSVGFWDSPEAMWLILGIWAISGPMLAWVFRGWLTRGTDFELGAKKKAVPATEVA